MYFEEVWKNALRDSPGLELYGYLKSNITDPSEESLKKKLTISTVKNFAIVPADKNTAWYKYMKEKAGCAQQL
jgi:hypothetical protein